jgi:hypothetical protein
MGFRIPDLRRTGETKAFRRVRLPQIGLIERCTRSGDAFPAVRAPHELETVAAHRMRL